jgi:hypothetical protein
MLDLNEILAQFFQQRPEADLDGIFHYLLREKEDGTITVDIAPLKQWTKTSDLLKNTLIIDCHQNELSLGWFNNGVGRAGLGGPVPIESILLQDDEDEEDPHRRLVFLAANIAAFVDLSPGSLSFSVLSRDYFDQAIYDESYRTLAPQERL